MERKTVLVIGGGYSGLSVCKALQSNKSIQVVLVDAREGFLLHKFSALRAATFGGDWVDKTLIPNNTIKQVKFIQGKLVHINAEANKAILQSGEEISYDALVICTGARNFSPAEPPLSITSLQETKMYFRNMHDAFERADKIMIYGAGLVGIEFAGELIDRYAGEKTVLLVKPKFHGLGGGISFSAKQQSSLLEMMNKSKNFFYIADETLQHPALPKEHWTEANPLVELDSSKQVKFMSGKQVKGVDLVVFCMGGRFADAINTLPNNWIHVQTGEIKIDNKFQVSGNVFALGDVAKTGHAKLGYMHMEDAPLVAENIQLFLQGKALKRSSRVKQLDDASTASNDPTLIAITFGRSKGRVMWRGGRINGNLVATFVKSKQLFAQKYRAQFTT